MQTLGKLFDSTARVKIMRLFLLNSHVGFEAKEIATRSKISLASARRELGVLAQARFIKKKVFVKESLARSGKNKKKKIQGWMLNPDHSYLSPLRHLLVDSNTMGRAEIMNRFKHVGKIKLFTIAGIFTKDNESRLDLMIVGDNLKKPVLDRVIKTLESELGRELSYAVFDTPDFTYRLDMYDKLVYDVLDYPHETLIDIVGLNRKTQKTAV